MKHRGGRKSETKREKKEELEFSYGIVKETVKERENRLLVKRMQLRKKLLGKNKAGKTFTVFEGAV